MARIKTANKDTIAQAAQMIRDGDLVAMPTETVYGLGANALDGAAVAKIFEAKGRPSFNPLIIHVNDVAAAEQLVEFNDTARALAQHFWPGPLTMILPRRADCPISELASAGLETLAIRLPAHKTARALIEAADVPIAAPSANRSGSLSPTTPAHVAESLGENVDLILADGACEVGLESTVIDLSDDKPEILRPGGITVEAIEKILAAHLPQREASPHPHEEENTLHPPSMDYIKLYKGDTAHSSEDKDGKTQSPKSPGLLLKHYAPNTPVRLNAIDIEPNEALLAFGSTKFMGVKDGRAASDLPATQITNLSENGDLHEAASNLFAMLKKLDRPEHKTIAVMNIPERGIGVAINDRLRRAAASAK